MTDEAIILIGPGGCKCGVCAGMALNMLEPDSNKRDAGRLTWEPAAPDGHQRGDSAPDPTDTPEPP